MKLFILKMWLLKLQNLQGSTAVHIAMTQEGRHEREACCTLPKTDDYNNVLCAQKMKHVQIAVMQGSYNVLKKSSRFRQIKRSRRAKLWGILQPGTLIWSRRRTPFVTQSLTLYHNLSLETDEYGLLPYFIVYLEKNNRQYVLVDNIHPLPILTRHNQKQFRN